MSYAIPLWDQPSLPIVGRDEHFPVRRIFCVGRNYAEHIREMGGDPDREAPFFFMKPADTLVPNGATIPYPSRTQDLHHEVELVIAIGKSGQELSNDEALEHVYGYAVGIDLTRRDLQAEMKQSRRPWEIGKAFENAAPCGSIQMRQDTGDLDRGAIWLDVNGARRQDGDLGQMIWSCREIITHLSGLFPLKSGDLVFTGTPDGVGPLGPGDQVTAGIEGLDELTLAIEASH